MVFPPRGPRRQLRRLRRLRRCSPRPRTRCTGSTTTRLVTSADISSASLQRPLRRIASRSSVVRLRVVSLPAPSSLAARVSASLERPSPVDSGRRGSLSSIVFTRSVHGFTRQYTGSPSRSLAFAHPGVDRAYSFRRHDRLGLHRSAKEVRRPPGYRVHRVEVGQEMNEVENQ